MRESTRTIPSPAAARRLLLGMVLALCAWGAPGVASAQVCFGGVVLASQASVDAFACTSVTGELRIQGADITDLTPLAGLTSVGGRLILVSNVLLASLSGLEGVSSVGGDLRVLNNLALLDLDGLSGLGSVGGDVGIGSGGGNPLLANIDGLSGLTSVNGNLDVHANLVLLDLNGLSNVTSVGGRIEVLNNDALLDLNGLSNITSVGTDVRIVGNTNLPDLDGLAGLTTVGGFLEVWANISLANIDGLSSLTSVGGDLRVRDNDALTALDGLSNVTSVVGNLDVRENGALIDLNGLSSITSVGTDLRIFGNTNLPDLDGLAGLTTVGGSLEVWTNISLASIDGLSSLTSVGGNLTVEDNDALTALDGLSNVTSVGGNLEVRDSAMLSEFCGLFPLLDAGGLTGSYNVSGNLVNPTQGDILAGGPCSLPTLLGPVAVFTTSQWNTAGGGSRYGMIGRSGLSGTGALELQTHATNVNAVTMWHAGPFEGGLGAGATGDPPAVADQEIVFDLGIPRELEGAYVWNHNQSALTARGIDQFEILTSPDSDPLTAVYSSVGTFNLAQAGGGAEPAQFVAFSASGARLLKFDIQTAHSGAPNDYVGLSEVLFVTPCTTHRWSFDDPAGAAPDGTPAPDVTCGDDGVVTDTGASHTGSGIQLPGGAAGSGAAYVDLPNGLVSSLDSASFEAWYTIDGPQFWARLFDFGASGGNEVPPGPAGGGTDYVFYAVSQGNNINAQRAEVGGGLTLDTALPSSLAQQYHTVVTVEADGAGPGLQLVTVYRDGVQVAQTSTVRTLAQVDDVNAWLGRSNFSGDGYLQGTIDEFRLYEEAMSSNQVLQSFVDGPDIETVALPEPGSVLGLVSGIALLAALARRRRARGDI